METSAKRIVDVNLNRASEAARVVEDITRFHLSCAPLAREAKDLRHSIREAPAAIGASKVELCAARDSEGDVSAADARGPRNGLITVASANFNRMQEAFRVLEEVSRDTSSLFSDLRYRAYALEKKVVRLLGRRSPAVLAGPCVCVIVTRSMVKDPIEFVRQAVSGGAGMIQLREKSLPDNEFRAYAAEVHAITSHAGALLVINDRADMARAVEADGVHVGQEDLPAAEARRVVGEDRVVGVSTHSPDEVRAACISGADYIGFGPIFETKTKTRSVVPPAALEEAVRSSSVPVYAIGGIGPGNVSHVAGMGVRCVAVCGSVASADDPAGTVAEMLVNLRK